MAKNQTTGIIAVVEAIDNLSYREMLEFATLLHLQSEQRNLSNPEEFAGLLADAVDSFFSEEEEAA